MLRAFAIHGSVQNINISRVWEKLVPTLLDYFEGFKTSVKGSNWICDGKSRGPELEVEPGDATELLQSCDKTLRDKKLLLMDKPRKWFLEGSIYSGECREDSRNDKKDFEYDINLGDQAAAGFDKD